MNYTATGFAFIAGCSNYFYTVNYDFRFNVGDIAYLRSQAVKGILEKICIKQVSIIYIDRYTYIVRYFDTFNAFQDETELLTYDEAYQIVDSYQKTQAELRRKAAENCLIAL